MPNSKLVIAFNKTSYMRYCEFLDVSNIHHFSLSYRLNRKKIIKRSTLNNNYSFTTNNSLRIKIVLLTVVFSLTAIVGFISVAYVNGFRFQFYPDHSAVSIEAPENAKSKITEIIKLSSKSGYIIKNEFYSDSFCTFEYRNQDKKVLLTQSLIDVSYNVDTQGVTPEAISFLGNDGYLINKDNEIQIYWIMNGYLFIFVGNVNIIEAENLLKLSNFYIL